MTKNLTMTVQAVSALLEWAKYSDLDKQALFIEKYHEALGTLQGDFITRPDIEVIIGEVEK